MKWLNYVKLKTKLFFLIGAPSLGLIIILFELFRITSFTVEGMNNFANIETQKAFMIRSLQTQGLQAAQATRNIILNPVDNTAKKNYKDANNEFRENVNKLLDLAKDNPDLLALIKEIDVLSDEMENDNNSVQQIGVDGRLQEAVDLINTAVTPKWRKLKSMIIEAGDLQAKSMQAKQDLLMSNLDDFSSNARNWGIFILIFTALVGTFGILTIVKSIMGIKKAALKIADGNTSFTLSVKGNDEITELRRAFNQMIQNINSANNLLLKEKEHLQEVQEEIQKAAEESTNKQKYLEAKTTQILGAMQYFAQGDLTKRLEIEKQDEMGKLFEGFNQTIQNVGHLIKQVTESVQATASASNEISASAEEMAAGAQEQSAQTSEVASAINEMTKTIYDSAKNTSVAAENAKHSGMKAQEGGKVVNETIAGMNKIAEVVKKSADTVNILGQNSEKIGEIISVISDIADQTNLLALNAAIEAARAGEQGRGFAVVADEVRKLAERTTKATKEIAVMIKQIQKDTREAVTSMDEGKTQVENGKNLAAQAGDVLDEIVQSSQKVADIIVQVAATSEEQSSAAEQISRSIEGINNVTQESSMGIQQIAQASEDLNRLTSDLQKIVSQFHILSESKYKQIN